MPRKIAAIVSAHGKHKTKTDRLDYMTWYENGEEPQFTKREIEIAGLIADGYDYKQIASKLWLSYETVKTHVSKLRLKSGKRTAAGVVAHLFRKGLIE